MSQASTIVNDALEFLTVSSGLMPADPGQQQRGFKSLQRLMDKMPTMDIYLDMRRPASINADLREPLWSTEDLAIMLAYHSAPYFDAELSMHKLELYQEALNELRRRTGKPVHTNYPGNLPIGGGNIAYGGCFSHYYVGDTQYQYTMYDQRKTGEAKIYSIDFSSEAARRNTTVTSVVWSNSGSESGVISNESLAGSVAEAFVSFENVTGEVVIEARCTFATGEIFDGIIRISVVNPESNYLGGAHG